MHSWVLKCSLMWAWMAQVGWAQEFKIWSRPVQVHGFLSQGFVYTDHNNWLTMNTSQGSGAMTDMGLNISSQLTDKFRVGAQVYDRNVGQLGQWHPSVDWAIADYRLKNWFGIRAGKVKTTLGLYNDSQDLDFVHVFALLPQAIYPTDLRDTTIAHWGFDVYGLVSLPRRLGDVSFTTYAGHRGDSIYSGYPYLLSQYGTRFTSFGGMQYGADLRWNTPAKGLLIGTSRLNQDMHGEGMSRHPADPSKLISYSEHSLADWTNQSYASYSLKKLKIDSEYRRYVRDQALFAGQATNLVDVRGWYVAADYKIFKTIWIGSYYSRYTITSTVTGLLAKIGVPNQTDTSFPWNHIYDRVIALRVNPNRYCNFKVEGHFMEGYGVSQYPDGFYPQLNPGGFKPNTIALVVKTGVTF